MNSAADSKPRVISINISQGGIPKLPLPQVQLIESGLQDDLHNHEKHNSPMQAVSLIDMEDLDDLRAKGYPVYPGATGENLTVRGLSVDELHIGDRLKFSGGAELELTKARQPCYVLDAIDPQLKTAIKGRCGFLAKVIRTGEIYVDETIEVVARVNPPTCSNCVDHQHSAQLARISQA
jgi:MOSC domain-containing protein YiiM